MIARLSGKLSAIIDEHALILDVRGVGYLVYVIPNKTLFALDQEITFYTHMIVKENDISLFGFELMQEREAFITLNDVSGIGPKVALNILSKLGLFDMQNAVITKNSFAFKSVSGIGEKLAQRIVLELQGKILFKDSSFNNNAPNDKNSHQDSKKNDILKDAIASLIALGISQADSTYYANLAMKDGEVKDLQDLISKALKLRK